MTQTKRFKIQTVLSPCSKCGKYAKKNLDNGNEIEIKGACKYCNLKEKNGN